MKDDFGIWLSGFVDGEGYFVATLAKHKGMLFGIHPRTVFGIGLSNRDRNLLQKIYAYMKCGSLFELVNKNGVGWHVENIFELKNIIIPFFEKYPLYSEKRNDFLVWKEAVNLKFFQRSHVTEEMIFKFYEYYSIINMKNKYGKPQKMFQTKESLLLYMREFIK